MPPLSLKAPAKINLCLRVLGRRNDGFHEIDSLFVPVDLFDFLEITPRPGGEIELILKAPARGVPGGPLNLAWKAARAFCDAVPGTGGATIVLDKRIPAGGGLGGGSSDAAQVLLGMNRLAGSPLGRRELAGLAEGLGSDIPFFLYGGAARVRGRGEYVVPVSPPARGVFVLVFPGIAVSTAWAYRALGRGPLTNGDHHSMLTCSGDLSRPIRQWAAELHNDFEEAVLGAYPRLGELKRDLEDRGALGVVMSGSGSTLVGVFESDQAAQIAVESFVDTDAVIVRPLAGFAAGTDGFSDGA